MNANTYAIYMLITNPTSKKKYRFAWFAFLFDEELSSFIESCFHFLMRPLAISRYCCFLVRNTSGRLTIWLCFANEPFWPIGSRQTILWWWSCFSFQITSCPTMPTTWGFGHKTSWSLKQKLHLQSLSTNISSQASPKEAWWLGKKTAHVTPWHLMLLELFWGSWVHVRCGKSTFHFWSLCIVSEKSTLLSSNASFQFIS